ncbi:transglycosylase domain-containing protein [Leucobacter aridicollis]|uniref:transglycosylase domain-containing protein n=1 Tax=Leucobacter aridicollis TaxID=283878 RepID=UPI0021040DA0|nr:transglycosylase domain-containing protein [Leucobacter aridicollis]
MTPKAPKSSRVPTAKPRSVGGVVGGILGAVAMSAIAGILVTAAVTPVVALSGAAATSAVSIFENLPSNLKPGQLAEPSTLYAKQGDKNVKIAEFYEQDRIPVGWDDISPYAKDALVAIEDPRFYTHGGVDALAASRAVLQNAAGGNMSGASTITMQYVRNVLVQESTAVPDPEEQKKAYEEAMQQTMDRKLKEMKLAIGVEKKFTKDEILTGYMNIALFGRQVYGIESAAHYYYNTTAKDLTLPQAASLIAIVNQPTAYQLDIEENVEANKTRRDLILNQMYKHGKITEAQRDEAIATPVEPKITPRVQGCAAAESTYGLGHFCDFVQNQMKKDESFGPDAETRDFNMRRGGYDIYTTIDLDLQKAATDAVRAEVPKTMEGIDVGGATVSTEVGTGRVLAMAQNRPYSNDEALMSQGYTAINYSTDQSDGGSSGFQVGSTFKAITLAEWIRSGHSVRDVVNVNGRTVQLQSFGASCMDGGVYDYGSWEFKNDNLGVRGNQSVLTAVAQSLNGGFVSMQQQMDLCDTFALAKKLGLHRASPATHPDFPNNGTLELTMNPSNTFGGTDEMSPLTMSTAFGAFAGKGKVCTPVAIDSITGPTGEAVPFKKSECSEALSPEVAAGVAYALEYTINNGIAGHARSQFGIPHLAKTGTTDEYIDNWTVGASSKVSTATWVGNVGPNPQCLGQPDCSRVDTRNFGGYQGLTAADSRIWPAVMYVADEKFGGEGFGDPAATALRQTMVNVPDVTGKSFDEAAGILENARFSYRDGGEVDSSVPKGMIARTDPGAGAATGLGTEITLYRSRGNAAKVPGGLGGMTAKEAESALKSAGFTSVTTSCTGGGKVDGGKDKVESVSPAAGEEVALNSRVTLSVKCS